MRDLGPDCLAFSLVLSLAACTAKQDPGSSGGEGKAPASTPPDAAALDTCAAAATLYPRARMTDTTVKDELLGKLWARRDGGMGSPHGPPMKWRRNTDLRFAARETGVSVSYEETLESTGEEPGVKAWSEDCQICGEVLVCGQQVWALGLRTNMPPSGNELRVLDTAGILELGDHDLYLIRHGHEIHLGFGADPLTTKEGPLKIRIRKLEAGAEVVEESTTFESEKMIMSYEGRTVRVELPGEVEGIRIDYRPDRGPEGAGYGTDTSKLRSTLYEFETLKRNPQLTDQPKSLEISEDEAEGFNLPH